MRTWLILLATAAITAGGSYAVADDGPQGNGRAVAPPMPPTPIAPPFQGPRNRQVLLFFRICEKEAAGEQDAGAVKVLVDSMIVMVEGRSFSSRLGREITVPDGSSTRERQRPE